jgi:hypothetical protein
MINMPTPVKNSKPLSTIEQVKNNTTIWIGHHAGDTNNIISGQTFISHSEGELDRIEVFSSIITGAGKVMMTLYSFDSIHQTWGAQLGSASVELNKNDSEKWICFNISGIRLHKSKGYGFRLESPNALIGVGGTAGSYKQPPFKDGQEWEFTSKDKNGHAYSYFSLAFKIGLRA